MTRPESTPMRAHGVPRENPPVRQAGVFFGPAVEAVVNGFLCHVIGCGFLRSHQANNGLDKAADDRPLRLQRAGKQTMKSPWAVCQPCDRSIPDLPPMLLQWLRSAGRDICRTLCSVRRGRLWVSIGSYGGRVLASFR